MKEKYMERVWKYVAKLEEMKWLCNIVLQNSEIISRSQNNQLPATLIMLKEDLEQKRSTIQSKIKDSNAEIENDREELRVISEDDQKNIQELLSHRSSASKMNTEREQSFAGEPQQPLIDVDPLEFYRVREENEGLKNKLQTQFYEISSLKSQLKLASSLEETKRLTMRDSMKRSGKLARLNSTNAKYQSSHTPRHNNFDDDEGFPAPDKPLSTMEPMVNQDFLLMMHIQATSLEMLINSTY